MVFMAGRGNDMRWLLVTTDILFIKKGREIWFTCTPCTVHQRTLYTYHKMCYFPSSICLLHCFGRFVVVSLVRTTEAYQTDVRRDDWLEHSR